MAHGWTSERKAKQAQLIHNWKPWEKSAGPRSAEGKAIVSGNANKGGAWRELRAMTKRLNGLLRRQRNGLREMSD